MMEAQKEEEIPNEVKNDNNNEVDIEAKLAELLAWFNTNPNLPEEIDPILLKRFLKCMFGDVEETKKIIELNYALRNKHRNLFLDRDPLHEKTQISRNSNTAVPLPGLTPQRYKIVFMRIEDIEPHNINNFEDLKTFYIINDSRLSVVDHHDPALSEWDNLSDGDIMISDIKKVTMRHMTGTSFSLMRLHMRMVQEALPVRVRGVHVINCPSYMDTMMRLAKPFMNEEVFKMMHFHTEGLESLYEHVPKDMLPEEYGGKAPPLLELRDQFAKVINEKRDYIMDEKHWKMKDAERKRSRWGWWGKA